MLIQVYQSGGFAGGEPIPLGRLDTAGLPAAEQRRVRNAIGVIEKPPEGTVPVGADMVEYRIEVAENGRKRTVVVADDMDPDNPLLRSVRELLEIMGSQF